MRAYPVVDVIGVLPELRPEGFDFSHDRGEPKMLRERSDSLESFQGGGDHRMPEGGGVGHQPCAFRNATRKSAIRWACVCM